MKLWNFFRLDKVFALLIITALSFFFIYITGQGLRPAGDVFTLDDGWNISYNGVSLDTASISSADIGVVRKNDVITLRRTLEDLGLSRPCATMYTVHAIVDVYLDGNEIYSFGHSYLESDKTVPKRFHYFPLGNNYVGKELTIVLSGAGDYSFSGIPAVTVGERGSLFQSRIIDMRIETLMGCFLVALGLILMVLSPYLVVYHNNDMRLFFSGLISILLGLYTFAYYGLTDMIFGSADLNFVCEYSSVYNIPTAILGYLMSVNTGRIKKLFRILFVTNICVFCLLFVLTVIGSERITSFSMLLHLLATMEGVVAIINIIYDFAVRIRSKEKNLLTSDSVFSIGLLLFMMLALYDIFRFYYVKFYLRKSSDNFGVRGFSIGALIFVSGLLISYLLYIIYNANMETMQTRIVSLAYTDPLTGLANRARCEQVMEVLSKGHGLYTIISLDLNKLKPVNDTLGHQEGDRLLSGFATILSDCFFDANLVGRMGGDEFIVILTEDRSFNCTRRIHELYAMISDWNHKETKFSYSTSYGYAYSYEVPSGSAQEVYMLADSRMYEMKKEHHKNSGEGVPVNA